MEFILIYIESNLKINDKSYFYYNNRKIIFTSDNIAITLKQLTLLKTYNSNSFLFIRFEKIISLSINAILNVVSVSQAYVPCLKLGIWK